jgi:hypothetical protein
LKVPTLVQEGNDCVRSFEVQLITITFVSEDDRFQHVSPRFVNI